MTLTREQDRDRMRRKRAAMTAEERAVYNEKARLRKAARDRARGVQTWAERYGGDKKPRVRKRTARVKAPRVQAGRTARVSVQLPAELRTLYSKADPNSAIRRRYPTWDALRAGWSRGELPS